MSLPGLLLSLLLAGIAIAIVAAPLLRSRRGGRTGENHAYQQEQHRVSYERVLTNILDLDEDLATGKISEADHQTEREIWLQRGIQLLRALDSLEDDIEVAHEDADIDQAIEAAVAAHRAGAQAKSRE